MPTLLTLSSLSFPSAPQEVFGRSGPLLAEIGVGSGRFLETLAARRPDSSVLGIERAPQSVARTYRRIHRSGLSNARLIKADAAFVIRNVIPSESLEEVYVNFPDPWPRRKHRKRRLLNTGFLELLASRFKFGGKLLLTTDHPEYFSFVRENAEASGLYEEVLGDPPSDILETKYAIKWANRELDIHHAVFTRTGRPRSFDIDVEIIADMHHAVLEGEIPDFSDFERRTLSFRGGVAVVLEVYRELDGSGLAFLVHVEENDLSQDIVIELRRGKNGLVLGVKRFGEPLHTRGVGEAVRLMTNWLQEQGMAVIHHKY